MRWYHCLVIVSLLDLQYTLKFSFCSPVEPTVVDRQARIGPTQKPHYELASVLYKRVNYKYLELQNIFKWYCSIPLGWVKMERKGHTQNRDTLWWSTIKMLSAGLRVSPFRERPHRLPRSTNAALCGWCQNGDSADTTFTLLLLIRSLTSILPSPFHWLTQIEMKK